MTDHMTQDEVFRLQGFETIHCPECGHGIDPHGTDPGGICGVGDEHGDQCGCLMSPNGIAYALLTPDVTPAQKHYDEAERLLGITVPGNLNKSDDQRVAAAQVHATLAQAASNEALLQFVATHVAGTVVNGLNKYFGGVR
ncbi:hypothetical protein [Gordonia alkanivorans]|uniref:hypothetical protein n=1 Tax=Gordonia alkanivorans TaxID=84096 RepID=UPI0024B68967|nr:hypothetical protein [Gordonia alkanivorans]MDJ0010134.1 hypothetical protein [Gordonia alkanivorans]MDJ0495676.1 hypothetical protein [Gordonia alkanivorans]